MSLLPDNTVEGGMHYSYFFKDSNYPRSYFGSARRPNIIKSSFVDLDIKR